ncbi:MAG: translesion error-prone DNA polymerase V autoproteolytic subunit [Desulfovibrio sp.]|uniref:LexA family protein n=1 Tax=Desulfovibrio sp. TaxID=885 RepID=UPI001A64B038|nr:translesion error-prone DNA polymerase V autoproteolytic subunit [Desulfovibrio sp.]MBD5418325.1 translesion error-prone DNA polymerase V autoproteolytic subunit [Desulfovibrio sp.]
MNATPPRALKIVGRPCDDANTQRTSPLYLSPVSAGFPSAAEDYIDSQINLHELLVRNPAATFFLRASGDSMLGVGIHDGDLLVVDRSLDASHNRVVIAALDGELLVKKLYRKDGRVFLKSANTDYPDFDITEREHVHIWGVVSHVIHRL